MNATTPARARPPRRLRHPRRLGARPRHRPARPRRPRDPDRRPDHRARHHQCGGLRIQPDLALDDLRPERQRAADPPRRRLWDTGDALAPFARTARAFLDAGRPGRRHLRGHRRTRPRGPARRPRPHQRVSFYLAATGYAGGGRYVEADAVTDGGLITAGPTEPVAFAREILRLLGVYEGEVLDAWYRLFHDSDPAAYGVLEKAGAL